MADPDDNVNATSDGFNTTSSLTTSGDVIIEKFSKHIPPVLRQQIISQLANQFSSNLAAFSSHDEFDDVFGRISGANQVG